MIVELAQDLPDFPSHASERPLVSVFAVRHHVEDQVQNLKFK
jgi:hypothetical protein